MIQGNITNKPLTRWAALRGPRRVGRDGLEARLTTFLVVLVARFFVLLFFAVLFLDVRFFVMTCHLSILRATPSPGLARFGAPILLRFLPWQTTTA